MSGPNWSPRCLAKMSGQKWWPIVTNGLRYMVNGIHALDKLSWRWWWWWFIKPDIGLAVRVFANGPGDLGSIPGRVIPKTQKMVLDASLLNTQHYKVRIKGKVEPSREGVAPSPTSWCSSYRKGSLRVTLDYGRQLYFTLLILFNILWVFHASWNGWFSSDSKSPQLSRFLSIQNRYCNCLPKNCCYYCLLKSSCYNCLLKNCCYNSLFKNCCYDCFIKELLL